MKNRRLRNNSGQVLIISSLIITMLLLSTALYVAETEKAAPTYEPETETVFSLYKLGTMHTVTSALANISNGGNATILVADLNQFKSAIAAHSYDAIFKMEFTPLNVAPYQDGAWIAWGSNGKGVSGVYVNFAVNSSGTSAGYYSEYAVNMTSELNVSGYYAQLTGTLKQVNLTCTVYNEGKPALAQNFTIYYEQDGSLSPEEWVQASAPSIVDYGNGTYCAAFTAETTNVDDPMLVSVHCHDLREVFVKANATCTKV
jgi:hypothetical protein